MSGPGGAARTSGRHPISAAGRSLALELARPLHRRLPAPVGAALRRKWSPPPEPAPALSTEEAALLAPVLPLSATHPPGPRIVMIDDCRDQINFGAEVLMDGLVASLQLSLPNATLLPVPSHWLMDVSGGYAPYLAAGEGMRQPLATFPEVADQFESVADEWDDGRGGPGAAEFLERFTGADLVVLNGEGSMYRTNTSAIRELFLAWYAKRRLGIPTVFLNGTVHLTDVVPLLPAMVRKTFSALDAVAVRESFSLRNLAHYAPAVEALLIPDSAFMFDAGVAAETPAVTAIRERIAGRQFFCFDPGAMHMDHRLPYRSAAYDLVGELTEVVPCAVLVNSSPADSYFKEIAAETGAIYVDTLTDYREYMSLVGDAQFVVTGRYHNPILAAIMGTPSVTFASANHKVHGACEILDGIIGAPHDGTSMLPLFPEIVAQARAYVEDRVALRDRLLGVCAQRRVEAAQLGSLVAGVLASTTGTGAASTTR